MGKLRICILYDTSGEDEDPGPEKPKSLRVEDEDRYEVMAALRKAGHEVFFFPLDGTAVSLVRLAKVKADLFFNLTESFAGDDTKEMNVAAYLELLNRRFTGAGPQGLYLAQDKALAKKIFSFHGIRTPFFATVYKGRLDWADDIKFPVIVKPGLEDGSIGIGFSAVVNTIKDLMERIHALQSEFDAPVLIEEYIEGREIYVGAIGNEYAQALPIVELDLSPVPDGTPKIAGTEVKWERGTRIFRATRPFFPGDLDEELVEELQQTAITAFHALKLRDYGRIDIRLTAEGEVHVIEVNPNPWLLPVAEFALAAEKAGIRYEALIARIAELAMARYGGSG